jgi:hypothetical protein
LREFRASGDASEHNVGDRIGVEVFQEGDFVDITATSKGRGFAGGVKRHGFSGGPKTHGQSDRHRAPGAIGAGNTPGRTFKGMRMAGHMGDAQVTVRNLEVIESDPARGLLIIAGAVPGARDGLVKIRYSKRTLDAARTRKPQPREQVPAADEEGQPEAPEAATAEDAAATDGTQDADAPVEATAAEGSGDAPEAEGSE